MKRSRPWWHRSLLWACLLWLLSAGWLVVLPGDWPKGVTVAVAVCWFAFVTYLWLSNDDPSPPPSDDASAPDPERWRAS